MDRVILYDILSKKTNFCWSPNTWKARLALTYKDVPFTTEWISYPDIKTTFPHLSTPDKPLVTLPIIKTQNGELICDSWNIAEYLEQTYPASTNNSLFRGHEEAHYFFQQYVSNSIVPLLRYLVPPRVPDILDERGAEYFKRTRQEMFGMPLEEMAKQNHIDKIDLLKVSLKSVHNTLLKTNNFISGDEITYSDIILLSVYLWIHAVDEVLLHQCFEFFEGGVEKDWYYKCRVILRVDEDYPNVK